MKSRQSKTLDFLLPKGRRQQSSIRLLTNVSFFMFFCLKSLSFICLTLAFSYLILPIADRKQSTIHPSFSCFLPYFSIGSSSPSKNPICLYSFFLVRSKLFIQNSFIQEIAQICDSINILDEVLLSLLGLTNLRPGSWHLKKKKLACP